MSLTDTRITIFIPFTLIDSHGLCMSVNPDNSHLWYLKIVLTEQSPALN